MNVEDSLIAVDFDNTLTTDNVAYWADEDPEPNEEVIAAVRELYHNGAHIVIWTARPWSEANVIEAHLTEWGVKHHGIMCEKGSADAYIDDKAVRPDEAIEVGFIEQMLQGDE
jgi:hydroxymethylpyrimidine pyrophosphatase-like HAD family hydrolase